MKQLLILLLVTVPFFVNAQKAPKAVVINDTVFVGEARIMLLEKSFYGGGNTTLVKDLEGNVKGEVVFDPVPYGGIYTAVIGFSSIHLKARVEGVSANMQNLARYIIKNKLFVNGDWDEAVVAEFVKTHMP